MAVAVVEERRQCGRGLRGPGPQASAGPCGEGAGRQGEPSQHVLDRGKLDKTRFSCVRLSGCCRERRHGWAGGTKGRHGGYLVHNVPMQP